MVWEIIVAAFIIFIAYILIKAYLSSPTAKGHISEQSVAHKLNIDSIWKQGGEVLTNIYIPKPSGDTAEIDLLYITRKGIFVFENKNYAGYIFGNEINKNWTVTLYAGKTWYGKKKVKKISFYNPVWQNRTHIKYLKSYLGTNVETFSFITFSDRGVLKSIDVNSQNVFVCTHSNLSRTLRKIQNNCPDILTDSQINSIYKKLLPLTNTANNIREKHVSDIQKRFSSTDTCPICGGRLIERTARKGLYAGNQFLGCSNYPKCKYTKNL